MLFVIKGLRAAKLIEGPHVARGPQFGHACYKLIIYLKLHTGNKFSSWVIVLKTLFLQ